MPNSHSPPDDAQIALPERRSDRPVRPVHYLELALTKLLSGAFRIIGVDAASALAGGFTRFVGPLIRPVSKRAEDNLAAAFPEWTEKQIRQTTQDIWENLGRTAGEFIHLSAIINARGDARIEFVGQDIIERLRAAQTPAVFVSGHFANWEIMAGVIHKADIRTAVVYRAANNPLTDEFIIHQRGKVMTRRQVPKGPRGGRALVEAITEGRSLMMLVDQKLNTGISVPFMGRPAMTAPAAARLALKFGAPVVFLSIERLNGAHFRMTAHEPIDFQPSGEVSEDVYALTEKINQALEAHIRAHPGQWLWLHRRWPKE